MTKEQFLILYDDFRRACFKDLPYMTNDISIKLFAIWYQGEKNQREDTGI